MRSGASRSRRSQARSAPPSTSPSRSPRSSASPASAWRRGSPAGQDGDRRAFAVLVAACMLASPIVWPNYAALLFVPIAMTWPRLAPVWFFGYVTWLLGAIAPKPTGLGRLLPPAGRPRAGVGAGVTPSRCSGTRAGMTGRRRGSRGLRERPRRSRRRPESRPPGDLDRGPASMTDVEPSVTLAMRLARPRERSRPARRGLGADRARVDSASTASPSLAQSAAAWLAAIVGVSTLVRGGDRSHACLRSGSSPTRSSTRSSRRASPRVDGPRSEVCRSSAGARCIRR